MNAPDPTTRNASHYGSGQDSSSWLDELWSDYAGAVWAYAARRVGSGQADDIVAQTFAIAWRHRDRRGSDQLPWLYGVARRVIANTRRATLRYERQVEALARHLPETSTSADPANVVAERTQAVQALAALSDGDREVLMLVAWEGLPGMEAASALGVSYVAFRARFARARWRLRRALARRGDSEMEDT